MNTIFRRETSSQRGAQQDDEQFLHVCSLARDAFSRHSFGLFSGALTATTISGHVVHVGH